MLKFYCDDLKDEGNREMQRNNNKNKNKNKNKKQYKNNSFLLFFQKSNNS
jgi:hypothetical protein